MKYLEYFLWFIICLTSFYNSKIIINSKISDSYQKGLFQVSSNPPLPGILDFIIKNVFPSFNNAENIIRSLIFLSNDLDIILTSIIYTIPNFNPSYTSIFVLIAFFNDNIFIESIFIGFSIISDLSAIFFSFLIILRSFFNLFFNLCDKKKSVKSTTFNFVIRIFLNITLPVIIYFSIFNLDYQMRNTLQDTQDFSIEFSSSFNIPSLHPTHNKVVSGSLISILNKSHRYFLGIKSDKAVGIKNLNSDCVWQINKVEGEDGIIKNDDLIRLINMKTNKVLSLNYVNNTDKFFELEVSPIDLVENSKNDIFKVICKEDLLTRKSIFELQNINSGVFLGMRRINENDDNFISAYTSIYSNKKHRLFYVSDNDTGSQEKKENIKYPELGFFNKVYENTKIIIKKPRENFIKTFHGKLHDLLVMIIPFFLIINYISKNRFKRYKEINTNFLIMYINSVFLKYIYCADNNYLSVCEVITNYYFLEIISRKMCYIYLSVSLGFLIKKM